VDDRYSSTAGHLTSRTEVIPEQSGPALSSPPSWHQGSEILRRSRIADARF
jgi:hypothetical protein